MRIGGSGQYNSDVVKTPDGWKIRRHRVIGDGGIIANPIPASAAAKPAAPQQQ
jgi:hypothetical protein